MNSPLHLNAIWDESIGLCYSPWECGCGQITGVRVHCSSSFDNNLIEMVSLLILNDQRKSDDTITDPLAGCFSID